MIRPRLPCMSPVMACNSKSWSSVTKAKRVFVWTLLCF